jgi:L-ribulokinase
MKNEQYVIGVDYGTDSVRSILVDAIRGTEIADCVQEFKRWSDGRYCDVPKNQFRQHPLDYIEGLEETIKKVLAEAGDNIRDKIKGISIDTTGSTPVAVDKSGRPLSLTEGFEDNPNAMFILWKDHTAIKEAKEINDLAKSWKGEDYTKYVGGIYSSEWFWAKILHVLRADESVRKHAFSWVEHCDWLPALLSGNTDPLKLKRSRCAAGHKAMWHESFAGLPSDEFLTGLDPFLKGLRQKLYRETYTSNVKAGNLCGEWAERLGLSKEVAIGVGAFDAHMGAVGGEIKPYVLSKVIGTSTCDMLIMPLKDIKDKLVPGICGQVDGSIVPGMVGLEAGQSAFGDIYAWFRGLLLWPVDNIINRQNSIDENLKQFLSLTLFKQVIPELSVQAEKVAPSESGVIALDWLNGRRTPDANQALKGALIGLNLGSDAPRIFRALVEATAFGAKKIVERFVSQGIEIREVIALGGVAKKAPFIMQVLADVLNISIKVARSEQACALGAAMFAAVAAGIYENVEQAQKAMGMGFEKEYHPQPVNVQKYKRLYEKYSELGEFVEKQILKEQ